MKMMSQTMFTNLIHDLCSITNTVLREIQTYDNVRIIPLSRVDNKQPYSIILTDEKGNDIDAKISYTYTYFYIDTDCIKPISKVKMIREFKKTLNGFYGGNNMERINTNIQTTFILLEKSRTNNNIELTTYGTAFEGVTLELTKEQLTELRDKINNILKED